MSNDSTPLLSRSNHQTGSQNTHRSGSQNNRRSGEIGHCPSCQMPFDKGG